MQRDRAFHSWPYPCIGQLRFLNLALQKHPLYPLILSRLTQGSQTLLDAGCCFGQELRKLAFDGVPPRALYGLDLEADFIHLGYDLFCDRSIMGDATFIAGNLLDDKASFSQLEGKIDIINANSLFHLFTWEEQITVTIRLVSFMKDRSGSMILGRQVGAVEAGEYRALNEGGTSYRHNVDSFQRLWKEVEKRTTTRSSSSEWEVEAHLDMEDLVQGVNLGQKWMEPGTRRLHFVVTKRQPAEQAIVRTTSTL